MAAGLCLHCQAVLPDSGRFCVMCGRRVGQSLREHSSDRRVYTSALGHSVSDLRIEIERRERSGEIPSEEPSEPSADPRDITARRRRPSDRGGALGELWRSLLWAVLLSTLGAVVAWAVYITQRPPSPPPQQPVASGQTAVRNASRPRPIAKAAPSRALVIPVAAPPGASTAAPAGTAPRAPETAAASPAAATSAPIAAGQAEAARPAAGEASAWQNNDIDFVASQHSPQVRACYDRAFRHAGDRAPAGRVELSFVLYDTGEAGQARDIVTELNLLGEPAVAACLEELVAEWRFPRPPPVPPGLLPHRLRYPFVFTPAPVQ